MLNACHFCCQRATIMLLWSPTCYYRCQRANSMLFSLSARQHNVIMRVVGVGVTMHHVIMVAIAPKCMFDDVIVVARWRQHDACHCRRPSQTTPSHHVQSSCRRSIMLMTPTLVIGASASSSPAIGPRAATTAPRPRSGCCGCPRTVASSANADDDSICPAASTAVFFGCRRYRDNASVDTEFFAR